MPSRTPVELSARAPGRASAYRTYRRNLATLCVVGGPAHAAGDGVALGAEQRARARPRATPTSSWRSSRAGRPPRSATRSQQAGVIDSSAAFQQVAASSGFTGATPPVGTTSSRTAHRGRRSTRCAADRAGSCPTSSCCSRPGSPSRRSPSGSASSRARARSAFLAAAALRTRCARSYEPNDVNSLEGLTWPDTYFIGANETEDADPAEDRRPVRRQGRRPRPRRVGSGQRRAVAVPDGRRARRSSRPRPGSKDDAPLISAVIVEPAEGRHAAADRRHPLLRQGRVPAGADRRRPQDRLAVQHLQDHRAPADADQDRQRGGAHAPRCTPRRCRTSTTCPTRTGRRTTRPRCRSTRRNVAKARNAG